MSPVPRATAQSASVHRLKVTLSGIRPPIWRRILVPSDITLARLHRILQVAMGWQDSHLHRFEVDAATAGARGLRREVSARGERTARLAQIAPNAGDRLRYEYDFGDSWEHDILVEAVPPPNPGGRYPVCVAGKRACPPEDCGGVWGYAELLEAMGNPRHPAHADLVAWLGGPFDPEAFDVSAINRRLAASR